MALESEQGCAGDIVDSTNFSLYAFGGTEASELLVNLAVYGNEKKLPYSRGVSAQLHQTCPNRVGTHADDLLNKATTPPCWNFVDLLEHVSHGRGAQPIAHSRSATTKVRGW